MRIKYPDDYTRRKKGGFLFFPKIVDRELRWLEYARWEEEYKRGEWFGFRWLDDELEN